MSEFFPAELAMVLNCGRGTAAHLAHRAWVYPTHPDSECACPVLDRPPPTEAYTPTAAQDAFLTTRDRTCRFPTVRREALIDRVEVKDLDRSSVAAGLRS